MKDFEKPTIYKEADLYTTDNKTQLNNNLNIRDYDIIGFLATHCKNCGKVLNNKEFCDNECLREHTKKTALDFLK